MKRLLLLVCLMGQGLTAAVCAYDGNKFRVTIEDKVYEQRVSPAFIDPVIACGEELMALYDGFDLTVFRPRERDFAVQKVSTDYLGAQLKVQGRLLGLFDGELLTVFDGNAFTLTHLKKLGFRRSQLVLSEQVLSLYDGMEIHFFEPGRGIQSVPANLDYVYPEGHAYDSLATMYDGTDLHLYDASHPEPVSETMASRSIFYEAALGKNRGIFYDGDNLFTYCSGKKITKMAAEPKVFVSSGYDPKADHLWMKIKEKTLVLAPDCKLAR